jgi:hypothetical protein
MAQRCFEGVKVSISAGYGAFFQFVVSLQPDYAKKMFAQIRADLIADLRRKRKNRGIFPVPDSMLFF